MKKFAVFGNPIKHSYSPKMHQLFAEYCGLKDFSYIKTFVDIDAFEQTVKNFFDQGGMGLNITVPFKIRAFELANILSDRASSAGAVNTLWHKDGKIYGDNTDGIGLVNDIKRLSITLNNARILLIGAGGASRGAILPLIEAGCSHLHIANRTEQKAHELIQTFSHLKQLSASGLDNITGQWDIIINASASSLSADELPLPTSVFHQVKLAYDMLYTADAQTPFTQQAHRHGALQCSDGLGMLVYQGAEAFSIWNGMYPNPEEVLGILRKELQCQV